MKWTILIAFFLIGIHGHTLPYSIPIHSSPNIPESRRNGRGLFSTLSGLGNVAVAAAAGSSLLGGKDPDDDDISSNLVNHLSASASSSSSSSSNANKAKPYAFNDVEMSAIQTMISIRNIIGDLLHKVGVNLPSSLASLITRSSDHNNEKHSLLSTGGDSAAASILSSASSKVNAALLIRGLALSLPLLIPMANQIRRMSTDSGVLSAPPPPPSSSSSFTSASQSLSASLPTSSLMVPPFQLPQFDPYGYDRALHRRRGKRSITATTLSESTQRMLRLREQQQILRYLRQMEEMYGIQPTYAQQQPQQQQQSSEPYYIRNVFIAQPQQQQQQQQQQHLPNHHYLHGQTRTTTT
ncbi:hypothetical protein DERF_005071 [Dermatophagoides farinae]|uniref:Uncharacterized protein n=1 Tax=Dermatophagoides farinae TaxID=6954 RepID=A0A922LAU2_DERFA|nr:hypothetical protein DERF_005071 [Dermatophagoides farinae]